MMQQQTTCARGGYMLIVTMLFLMLMMTLLTQLLTRTTPYSFFSTTMYEREQAKMLAYSGVQLAMSQLAYPKSSLIEQKKEEAAEGKKKEPSEQEMAKLMWAQLFPALNRLQTVKLTQQKDGIAGTIAFSISSEEGKFNINEMYDFAKHKFKGEGQLQGDMKKTMQWLCSRIATLTNTKNMFEGFEKFLKERHHTLNDVTELLTISEVHDAFKDAVFYQPGQESSQKGKAQQARVIYLTDIFTTWSDKATVNPWLFSESVVTVLEGKRAADDKQQREALVKETATAFTQQTDWKTVWDKRLAPLIGKKMSEVAQECIPLLESQFEPKYFFVVSYGTFGNITQRLLAIVKKDKLVQTDHSSLPVSIEQLYWI